MEKKNKGFIEDDFDLEEFKRNTGQLKVENLKKKSRPLLRVLSILIVVLAFLISYFAYMFLDYYIGLWRNENTSRMLLSLESRETKEALLQKPIGFFLHSGYNQEQSLLNPDSPLPKDTK